jgi:chorismate mutase/prephenate dehydratase
MARKRSGDFRRSGGLPRELKDGDDPQTQIAKLQQQIRKIDSDLLAMIQLRADRVRQWMMLSPAIGVNLAGTTQAELNPSNFGELPEAVARAIFREIAGGCRAAVRQQRVAFLGPLHSYSHLAAVECFGSVADWVPLPSIADVFAEVVAGHVDHAVVPLENSTDGRIIDTLSTFIHIPARICAEMPLRICHCLLAAGTRAEIRSVVSKPQALSQCRKWLASHLPDAELVESTSTTAAAAAAAQDRSRAAIASRHAASEYQLHVLADHIEDNPHNVTRFAVLGREPGRRTGRDKTAILFQVPHQPGALADVMAIFKRNRLNLTWIESFPHCPTDSPITYPSATAPRTYKQEYLFFLEFEGHSGEMRPKRALAALAKKVDRLDVLGSYPAVNVPA